MSTPKPAGFWIRGIANTVDSLVITPVWFVACLVFARLLEAFGIDLLKAYDGQTLQQLTLLLFVIISFPYFVYGHFRWGTTLGKKIFGAYVVSDDGLKPITLKQSILRFFGYILSSLPMGAGYLVAAFNPRKRALHDMIAGTLVVRKE